MVMYKNRIFMVEEREAPIGSLFSGYEKSEPIGASLLSDFFLQSTYKEEIEELRKCTDKARRRELKSKLPAITPSGIFTIRRNDALIKHSGFICIDIDGDQNPHITDWEALKSSLYDLTGLYYAGLSASGNGVFLIVKIKHPERHTEHFYSLARDLNEKGVVVDMACKDVARLRGASYDPAPFYSPEVAFYEGLVAPPTKVPEIARKPPKNDDFTARRVGRLVEAIERTRANIADYYPDWYAIGCALGSEFGEAGRDWYHIISSKSSKYELRECDTQYSHCLKSRSRISIDTLFYYCKQHGIMADGVTHPKTMNF